MSTLKITKEEKLISKYDPYKNKICDKSMSQEECELAILREAVDDNEKIQDEINKDKVVIDKTITRIFEILEAYIVKKKLLLYGGFAINALLPEYAKFYDPKHEIPDYDIYSPNALEDAIDLVDFFFENGFKDVETRAGVHYMTYKVFVNFITVADITIMDKSIFDNLQQEAVIINRIHYCPVNFLRRNIYKELSQPHGDIRRWEKIYKRLNKINENFPLEVSTDCENIKFQRKMGSVETTKQLEIYEIVKNAFIYLGAVFFGGYACSLYSQYIPNSSSQIIEKIPDFEVLYDDIVKGSQLVKERLHTGGFKRVKIIHHESICEIIHESYEIQVNNETVAFIYKPTACYSYNIVNLNKQQIKVASIDTMLFFCFTFYYSVTSHYSRDKNMCIINVLFKVEEENRLNQKGLLKRFSIECIGSQKNFAEIKEEKSQKFKELFHKRHTREYSVWFLKYNPVFQSRPAFMKHRNKFKKVRFSLKNHRYRYLPNYIPVVRSEDEIDDINESVTGVSSEISEPNGSIEPNDSSEFLSKQPIQDFDKNVRNTRNGRKNNAQGIRFALQNNKVKYHTPKKSNKYDILSESQIKSQIKSEDSLDTPTESQPQSKDSLDTPTKSQTPSEDSLDTPTESQPQSKDSYITPTESQPQSKDSLDTPTESHPQSKDSYITPTENKYNTTDKYNKRKIHNIFTRREKPFNKGYKKRYTRFNTSKIIDSIKLFNKNQNKNQNQNQNQNKNQNKNKIKKTINYETENFNQKENERKMNSLKEILGFKKKPKTKNEFSTPFQF